MTKLLPSVFLAAALIGGAAAPSMAASLTSDTANFDASYQVQRLRDAGVPAVAVAEDDSDTMRATVRLDDGSQVFQYFDIDSLQPKGVNAGATRVLTKLDVGHTAPVVSLDSLTHDSWDD